MYQILFLDKSRKEEVLPGLFQMLAANMSQIAPTGNTLEEDFAAWKEALYPALDRKERQILLIRNAERTIGYFQYYVNEDRFMMEEIQIEKDFQGTGAFQQLYRFLAREIPAEIQWVCAYAHKNNHKSQGILNHLGLEIAGENQSGDCYFYKGDCQKMLDRYR